MRAQPCTDGVRVAPVQKAAARVDSWSLIFSSPEGEKCGVPACSPLGADRRHHGHVSFSSLSCRQRALRKCIGQLGEAATPVGSRGGSGPPTKTKGSRRLFTPSVTGSSSRNQAQKRIRPSLNDTSGTLCAGGYEQQAPLRHTRSGRGFGEAKPHGSPKLPSYRQPHPDFW